MSRQEDLLLQAKLALDSGNGEKALRPLSFALRYPDLLPEETFAERMKLLSEAALAAQRTELAELAGQVAQSPDDLPSLYNLGYELYEQGLFSTGALVLARGHKLAPQEAEILLELCCCLENTGQSKEACDLLQNAPTLVEENPLCRYMLAFNSIVSADIETARAQLPSLKQIEDPEILFMTSRVERMILRADLCEGVTSLDSMDLLGWHFVLTGGLLLHRSPHGFLEGMSGRYAYLQDSAKLCALGLKRLRTVLSLLPEAPGKVLLLPERMDHILGLAAAELLGLPATPWSPDAPGLVVAYDLSRLELSQTQSLQQRTPDQPLFCHATCWTHPPFFAPDGTTLLYQSLTSPWEEGLSFDSETKKVQTSPPRKEAPERLAREITEWSAPWDELPEDDSAIRKLTQAIAPYLGESWKQRDQRERMFDSSPVKSSRFL